MSSSCCGGCEGGQCSRRKGPGKGRSPAAARAPLSGPWREGRRLHLAASSSFGPRRFRGYTVYGPASWPVSRLAGAVLVPQRFPSWTHEDTSVHARGRDRSPEERRTRHITAAVMRLHSLQVCLITRRQTWLFSAPLLSHTHSRREPGEGRRLRDGEMLIIRGRQPTRHNGIKKCKIDIDSTDLNLCTCTFTLSLYHLIPEHF